jgi:Cd2+/Zn2+-exporting ATPase
MPHAEPSLSARPEVKPAQACGACDRASAPRESESTVDGAGSAVATYRIDAMDCATEEAEIRRALDGVDGIRGLAFRLGARTLSIDAPAPVLPRALEAIRRAGFDPQPLADATTSVQTSTGPADRAADSGSRRGLARYAFALALAVAAEALAYFAPDTATLKTVGMAIALAAIALAGVDTYRKGWSALRRGRLTINALMSVAVTGAFAIGQWPEAATVMALFAIAELIEARAADRARNAIRSLMALAPDEAEVLRADGSWERVPAASVAVDAIARVKPGERVPLDGVITKGASAINQAPVTGESIAVDKQPGDPVFAGTINETATFEFRVTAPATNSTLARIIHAVEQAESTRAPTQRFVDRFAAVYTPAVFILALAVAVLTPLLADWTWTQAVYKALVLLVIACPCALVISTPVTVVSGLAAAARRGILIKGGTYLEDARRLKAIAFDKTGTITEGKPRLVAFEPLAEGADREAIARLAASLAAHSDHPVSKAIAAGLGVEARPVEEFGALAGRGVQGRVDGQLLVVGNHRLIEERGLCNPALEARLRAHEEQGRSVTVLAGEEGALALFAVADTIKPSSKDAIARLHALGVSSVMLTGDNPATARTIAAQAAIDDARGNLLPEDKLAAIHDLQRRYGPTAMIGDGINDAPALAQADLGVAMGAAGTDTAMEAADVVVMNDDLTRVADTIRLSRRTHAVLWQNIALALGIKAVFLVLAILGAATMWMAVFADMGASLLVVANGLRLLRD